MGKVAITVRQGMAAKDVTFEEAFWRDTDTRDEQVKQVLRSWTHITGLNWSKSAHKVTESEGYTIVDAESPLDNRSNATFFWKV